jgi:hypothetical protein
MDMATPWWKFWAREKLSPEAKELRTQVKKLRRKMKTAQKVAAGRRVDFFSGALGPCLALPWKW